MSTNPTLAQVFTAGIDLEAEPEKVQGAVLVAIRRAIRKLMDPDDPDPVDPLNVTADLVRFTARSIVTEYARQAEAVAHSNAVTATSEARKKHMELATRWKRVDQLLKSATAD